MTKPDSITPEQLAKEFCAEMKFTIKEIQFEYPDRDDKKFANLQYDCEYALHREKNDDIPFTYCPSHDYCDANMVMDAACENLGLKVNLQDDAHLSLMNTAWDLAKRNCFKL